MARFKATLAVLLLALILAACGDQPTPTSPTGTTDNSSSSSSSDTTGSSDSPANVELTQSYNEQADANSGNWAFKYPAGWVVPASQTFIRVIGSSDAVANKTFSYAAFEPGEVAIQLGVNTITKPGESVADHVKSYASSIGYPLGDASEIMVGGNKAGRVDGSNDSRHMMAISIVQGNNYVEVVAYTNPGEFEKQEPLIMKILETVKYTK